MTKVECIVKAMDDKLAQDIVAINMENASPLYDTLEGRGNAEWILIDAGDVICHIFSEEARKEYNLEKLWSDMPTIDIKEYLA